jgi:hypothetical protein
LFLFDSPWLPFFIFGSKSGVPGNQAQLPCASDTDFDRFAEHIGQKGHFRSNPLLKTAKDWIDAASAASKRKLNIFQAENYVVFRNV